MQIILHTLKKYNYNRTKCAQHLDIAIRTVRIYIAKMRKLGFIIPKSNFGVKEIQRKKCPDCEYYQLKSHGVWVCYACKHLKDKPTNV